MNPDVVQLDPTQYGAKERSELLAGLQDNVAFRLLQAMKIKRYQPIAKKVLGGGCKDFIEYKEECAFLRAVNVDEEIINQNVRKHPASGDGSERATIIGGDSVS